MGSPQGQELGAEQTPALPPGTPEPLHGPLPGTPEPSREDLKMQGAPDIETGFPEPETEPEPERQLGAGVFAEDDPGETGDDDGGGGGQKEDMGAVPAAGQKSAVFRAGMKNISFKWEEGAFSQLLDERQEQEEQKMLDLLKATKDLSSSDIAKFSADSTVTSIDWKLGTCEAAARSGYRKVLQWAKENGCEWDVNTAKMAAKSGRLELVSWLRYGHCPWDEGCCRVAAGSGFLQMLKWLRAEDAQTNPSKRSGDVCPWDAGVCRMAAQGGHLLCLIWARQNAAPWDLTVMESAAREGHLDVVKWARNHGCEWDPEFCIELAREPEDEDCWGGECMGPPSSNLPSSLCVSTTDPGGSVLSLLAHWA